MRRLVAGGFGGAAGSFSGINRCAQNGANIGWEAPTWRRFASISMGAPVAAVWNADVMGAEGHTPSVAGCHSSSDWNEWRAGDRLFPAHENYVLPS